MVDFVCNYFVDSIFESVVVGVFTADASNTIENNLYLVDFLGF